MKHTGGMWDWQQIRDYEERREVLRKWLIEQGRDDKIFVDDELMQEVTVRLLNEE